MFKLRIFVLFVLATLMAGCGGLGSRTGSGNVITQEVAITDFDKLDVSDGFQVDVRQGDTYSVVIRIDENLVEDLQVVKEGSVLKIGLESGGVYNIQTATLEADITMAELTGLDLKDGSRVTMNGFRSEKGLSANLFSGSHLQGDVEAGDAKFNLSGGSHVTLSGSAGDLTIDVDGGSHAKLADLAVVDAKVSANGGSDATVNPSGILDAVAMGGSHVTYLGSPTLRTIETDSTSTVKQK